MALRNQRLCDCCGCFTQNKGLCAQCVAAGCDKRKKGERCHLSTYSAAPQPPLTHEVSRLVTKAATKALRKVEQGIRGEFKKVDRMIEETTL